MRMTQAEYLAYNARTGIEQVKPGAPLVPCGPGVEREADLHDEIERELKRRGWYYVRSRMDRPTTCRKGCPDFIIAIPGTVNTPPRTLWLEAKGRKTKVTPEQAGALAWLDRDGHDTAVVRNLEQFLKAIA